VADRSLTGVKVATALTPIVQRRGAPTAITVDNGSEFVSRAMDAWAYAHDVRLDFIRPGKPVENAFIESFNGPAPRRLLECPCLRIYNRGAARPRK
jgi:putative transposase